MSTPPPPPPRVVPYDAAHEPLPAITMSVTVTVNGEVVTCQESVPVAYSERINDSPTGIRAAYEQMLRGRLGDAVVERLNPPLTVHVPTSLAEGVSAALTRADAAMGCQPLELGSES